MNFEVELLCEKIQASNFRIGLLELNDDHRGCLTKTETGSSPLAIEWRMIPAIWRRLQYLLVHTFAG